MPEGEAADRLRAAAEAARSLAAEAGRLRAEGTPPQGWATPAGPSVPSRPEVQAVAALLELVRATVPHELAVQVLDVLRELLLALRAVIDVLLERLDRHAAGGPAVEVEDIPIG